MGVAGHTEVARKSQTQTKPEVMFPFHFQHVGCAGERHIVAVGAACKQSEATRREIVETGVAVAAEHQSLVVDVVVPPCIPLITVEGLRAGGDEIVTVWEPGVARCVWPW